MSSTAAVSPAKKKVTISRSFLNTTNPEIFLTKPRPGGYVPLQEQKKKKCDEEDESQQGSDATTDKKSEKTSIQDTTIQEQISREFRIQKSLYDSTWTLSTLNSASESGSSIEVPTPVEDSIDMLCTALSTVMLLAADAEIPDVYITWTKNYFECIKDDFGHIPPNIQGILNHLAYLKAQAEGGSGAGSAAGSKRGSKTVRTTTTVRRRSSASAKSAEQAAEAPPDMPAVPEEAPPEEPPAQEPTAEEQAADEEPPGENPPEEEPPA